MSSPAFSSVYFVRGRDVSGVSNESEMPGVMDTTDLCVRARGWDPWTRGLWVLFTGGFAVVHPGVESPPRRSGANLRRFALNAVFHSLCRPGNC